MSFTGWKSVWEKTVPEVLSTQDLGHGFGCLLYKVRKEIGSCYSGEKLDRSRARD